MRGYSCSHRRLDSRGSTLPETTLGSEQRQYPRVGGEGFQALDNSVQGFHFWNTLAKSIG